MNENRSVSCCKPGEMDSGPLSNDIRGYLAMAALIAAAPIYCVFFFCWRIIAITLQLTETDYQRGDDFLFSTYVNFSAFLYATVSKPKVYLYGDLKGIRKRKESALCISNHQSAMDWILTVMLGYEQGIMPHTRFVMKGELSVLPYFGAILHYHGCIFVRRGDFHQDFMIRSLNRLNELNLKTWIVIFAEGTRMVPEKREQFEKSKHAAVKHDLPVLQQVLTPHWRGSWLILSNMRKSLDAVYSITFAYSDTGDGGNRRSAPGMTGASPVLYIHVKRIPMNEVPTEENNFGPWLHQEFVNKDKLMISFYQNGSTKDWGPGELQKLPKLQVFASGILYVLILSYFLLSPCGPTLYITGCIVSGVCSHLYMKHAKVC